MTHEHAQAMLPGIVLGTCPLPLGWNLAVAMVLACGTRLSVIETGVAEFMPGALAPALAACGRTLDQVDLIVNTHAHWATCRATRRSGRRAARPSASGRRTPPIWKAERIGGSWTARSWTWARACG